MFPANVTTGFDREAMEKLLLASAAAYAKPSEAEAIARAAGATEFYWISDVATDTQCFIAADQSNVVIAFRGTESVKDWLTDCKFKRRPMFTFVGDIHDGFADAYQAVQVELSQRIFLLGNHRPIWITGHSLGGALATVCACDLVEMVWPVAGVYTFGQPRVGDKNFADAYDSKHVLHVFGKASKLGDITFRLVNEEDVVPRIPGVLIGYRHCGREIFLDALGGVDVDPPIWKKVASDVAGIGLELSRGSRLRAAEDLIKDHFIAAYQARILGADADSHGLSRTSTDGTPPQPTTTN